MQPYRFVLGFVGGANAELNETYFSHPLLAKPQQSIRGRVCGAYRGYHTFQWTKAVQALALLCLRTMAAAQRGVEEATMLIGDEQSFALSLDYAIEKKTTWLLEMFGVDSHGMPFVRRLINRSNPGHKRKAPVALSLNQHFFPVDALSVTVDQLPVLDGAQLVRLATLIETPVTEGEGPSTEPAIIVQGVGERPMLRLVGGVRRAVGEN